MVNNSNLKSIVAGIVGIILIVILISATFLYLNVQNRSSNPIVNPNQDYIDYGNNYIRNGTTFTYNLTSESFMNSVYETNQDIFTLTINTVLNNSIPILYLVNHTSKKTNYSFIIDIETKICIQSNNDSEQPINNQSIFVINNLMSYNSDFYMYNLFSENISHFYVQKIDNYFVENRIFENCIFSDYRDTWISINTVHESQFAGVILHLDGYIGIFSVGFIKFNADLIETTLPTI